MPTYDYRCDTCKHTFEHFQMMSDDPLTNCPVCGKSVRRLLGGGSGIIFKGNGFYVTDNRKGSKGTNSESSKTEAAKTSSD